MGRLNRREMMATASAAIMAAGGASEADATDGTRQQSYRRIACEEGFLSPGVLEENARTKVPGVPLITADGPAAGLARALVDLGDRRLAAMDADGIDMQLLLLS